VLAGDFPKIGINLYHPAMDTRNHQNKGMERLLRQGRRMFRIPENLDYYSLEDLKAAEKKFLKLCLIQGGCSGLIAGPMSYCLCPECGEITNLQSRHPCSERKCPRCGAAMDRESYQQ